MTPFVVLITSQSRLYVVTHVAEERERPTWFDCNKLRQPHFTMPLLDHARMNIKAFRFFEYINDQVQERTAGTSSHLNACSQISRISLSPDFVWLKERIQLKAKK